jgi:hypothetical protein
MTPQTKDMIDAISKIVGVPGGLIAAFSALYAFGKSREDRRLNAKKEQEQRKLQLEQMEQNRKINEARFWLELRKMFGDFADVHLKLRGGDWPGPDSAEEWTRVEAYMGLFEHCSRMLQDKLIGIDTFKRLYGYRIGNILANRRIVEKKLIDHGKDWQDFIELVRLIGRQVPRLAKISGAEPIPQV